MMPPPFRDDSKPKTSREPTLPTLREVADRTGIFPEQAFLFLQSGLSFTVAKIHGKKLIGGPTRHVTGQQLCEGLRDYAHCRWGKMARTVLAKWNITGTLDFGRMVFTLVDAGLLKTTDGDTLDDFRDIYDFATLETGYQIECPA